MRQPNILLVLTDQQRLSTVNWYEAAPWNEVCRIPNLDRLREQSVLFSNAYTPCPLCSPARASIMTGITLRTLRHGPWKYGFSFGMEEQLNKWMKQYGDPIRKKGYLPYVMRRGFSSGGGEFTSPMRTATRRSAHRHEPLSTPGNTSHHTGA